jgi:lysophospholipase L1-like esterase
MRLVTHRSIVKAGQVLVSLLVGLLVTEFGLRLAERRGLGDRAMQAEPDALLGHRVAAEAYGHDANGFRNDTVPAHTDIVALGDSQTWGVNAIRSTAWPQALERRSRRTVYNMGLGGYGPVQYWVLTDKATQLSPKIIVIGLYFGNDMYDAYSIAYHNDAYASLRQSDAADKLLPDAVEPRAAALWDELQNYHNNYGRSSSGWSYWLRGHSAIGRLLTRTGLWDGNVDVWYEIGAAWAQAYPDQGAAYKDNYSRTVLAPAYRLTALDLDEVRIVEGVRLTKDLLRRIKRKTDQEKVKLLVLYIPTKEMVYAEAVQNSQGQLKGSYAKLTGMEARIATEITSFCDQEGIEHVDALPQLREAVRQNKQIYPSDTESHPNAQGYSVLASTVNEALTGRGW